MPSAHPRDRFITVYGRKPVLEALQHDTLTVHQVLVAHGSRGEVVDRIQQIAAERGLELRHVSRDEVTRVSRNRRQDQGVVADIVAPGMDDLEAALEAGEVRGPLLALDGVTTPANVGMILRSATAAGVGVVLPRQGSPEVGPLVVKASAGVAFQARILRSPSIAEALEQLRGHGYRARGLDGSADTTLWDARFGEHEVLVLGGETHGLSPETRRALEGTLAIPMAPGVESLNVAAAATLVAFALRRRGG